jgi:hypothetical protein
MNVLDSHANAEAVDRIDSSDKSAVSKLTADILPACFLLGIISGFSAFVAFGQAIFPGLVAAAIGVFLGLFFACDENRTSPSASRRHTRH